MGSQEYVQKQLLSEEMLNKLAWFEADRKKGGMRASVSSEMMQCRDHIPFSLRTICSQTKPQGDRFKFPHNMEY